MRSIRAFTIAATMGLSSAAMADTRIFIIDNSDGYGVDGCLSSGAPCGLQIATAWCHSHDYSRALDFGDAAEQPALPGGSSFAPACQGVSCPRKVTITCAR